MDADVSCCHGVHICRKVYFYWALIMEQKYKSFYEDIDRQKEYSTTTSPEQHGGYKQICRFIETYGLADKKVLEIGSSKGVYQNMVADYTGLDIAESLRPNYHKPFYTVRDDGTYPLEDDTFDAAWTWAVFEHIPDIDTALRELCRVIKPGGHILFAPAWQCRSWAADGYPVRPYSDFGLKGKLIKLSVPIRNSLLWRSAMLFPKRVLSLLEFYMGRRPKALRTKKMKPNYDVFWMSDSDAVHSIDPFDAIVWFESNGFKCLNQHLPFPGFLVRNGSLILEKLPTDS